MSFRYMSLSQLLESGDYPFTVSQMRAFLLNREKNGLNQAVRKIGRRVYFRLDLFEEWIEGQSLADKKL